ncbi:MAG: J domain-containing protein [Novosphingobium sp.]
MKHDRFHGRVSGSRRSCDWRGCDLPGEFRAPGARPSGFDGPGDYRWYCLEHIREFNASYDAFAGMTAEEIWQAQSPIAGWDRETRAFNPTAGIDAAPRWADFSDPLEAISGRARARRPKQRLDGRAVTPEERQAFDTLELDINADRKALRGRYSELARRFHPDRNGGDRAMEKRLQAVVEAYQLLRKSAIFA